MPITTVEPLMYGVFLLIAPMLGLAVICWGLHRLNAMSHARDRALLHRVRKVPHLIDLVQLTDSGRLLLSVRFTGESVQVFEHFDSLAAKQIYTTIQSWAPTARFVTHPPGLLEPPDPAR